MATKPNDKSTLPRLLPQNPSPISSSGNTRVLVKRQQVDRIMETFLQMLPSNYVSQVTGPFYTIQFQAIAEQIADFQISAQEVFADSDFDFTRSEFLFQIIGSMVFPDAATDGYPKLQGDLTYRGFLKRMVTLLLQGATKSTVEGGLELLSDATWTVIEKALAARTNTKKVWNKEQGIWETHPGSIWGLEDQFGFEIFVSDVDSQTNHQRFPTDPIVLQENVRIVLRALKPAHTLYDYRHLFTEAFGHLFGEAVSWNLSNYYYEDFRRFCCGIREISGTSGITWTDKTLFSDTSRDFTHLRPGASLTITSGPNSIHSGGVEGTTSSVDAKHIGRYLVVDIRSFPLGTDSVARAYTTSPSGLSGKAVVEGDVIQDSSQNFANTVEGEVLTFLSGPNAGSYRLRTLLGLDGGPVGVALGPATRVRVATSLLRVDRRMGFVASGQNYIVSVDRLGEQTPHTEQEDVSNLFWL